MYLAPIRMQYTSSEEGPQMAIQVLKGVEIPLTEGSTKATKFGKARHRGAITKRYGVC